MTRKHLSTAIVIGGVLFACTLLTSMTGFAAPSLDQFTDLTGRASVAFTLKGRDNFPSEYRYDVSVRKHTTDGLIAESAAPSRNSIDKLIQLLIKKGVLAEKEWRKANQP